LLLPGGASAILALRCSLHNHHFDSFWRSSATCDQFISQKWLTPALGAAHQFGSAIPQAQVATGAGLVDAEAIVTRAKVFSWGLPLALPDWGRADGIVRTQRRSAPRAFWL